MKGVANGSSVKPDYQKDGYSAESLRMLESEEGQLNAVFACYGSAAQHGQLFEDSLSSLLEKLNGLTGVAARDAGLDKKTTGQLLWMFRTKFVEEIDEWVPEFLDQSRKWRNFLIHEYFLKRKEQMGSVCGRLAMLRELAEIEAQLRRAAELVNGLGVAIDQARKGERGGSDDETIFSVTLRGEGGDRVGRGGGAEEPGARGPSARCVLERARAESAIVPDSRKRKRRGSRERTTGSPRKERADESD